MTPTRLKAIIAELISRTHPRLARKLLENFLIIYDRKLQAFCKVLHMIEINTSHWENSERMNFLRWYYRELKKATKQTINET